MEILEKARLRSERNRKRKAEEEGRVMVEREKTGRRVVRTGKRRCLGDLVNWNEGRRGEGGRIGEERSSVVSCDPLQVTWDKGGDFD